MQSKGTENLSKSEKQLINRLNASKKRSQARIDKEKKLGSENKKLKREKGNLEYRLKELEDALVLQKDFLSSENIKSKTIEIKELKKTIKKLDKEINKTINLHGGFGVTKETFKNIPKDFLLWLKKTNDKGNLIQDNQMKIFDYIDTNVNQNKFQSLMSIIDNSIQKSTYPMQLRGMPEVNQWYALRSQFIGKGYVADYYVNKITKDWKNYSAKDLKQMYDVLNGTDKIKNIKNPKLLEETKIIRNIIDDIGQSLVDRNLLSKEAYELRKGEYIARVYDVYLNDKKNITKFDEKPLLRYRFKKQRKNLSESERKAFGEITDPSIPFSETVARSLTDVFANDLMQAALNNPKWVAKGSFIELKNGIKYGEGYLRELQLNTGEFIRSEKRKGRKVSKETQSMYDEITSALEKYDKNPPIIDRKRFQEARGPEHGILQGAYVDKGILSDLEILRGKDVDYKGSSKILKFGYETLRGINTLFKTAKVPLNIPTVAKNTISATLQTTMSGTGPVRQLQLAPKVIKSILSKDSNYITAAENGLFRGNYTSGELRFADKWSREISKQVDNGVPYTFALQNITNKYLKKGAAEVIGFYGKIDNFYKYTKYLDEISKGKKPVDAARIAQESLFDYSLVGPTVQTIREFTPFVTFFTKSAAFTIKSLRNNPGRAGLVIGTPIAYNYFDIAEKSLKNQGVSDQEWEEYLISNRKNLSKGGFITLPYRDENGNFQTTDISTMLPSGEIVNIASKFTEIFYKDDIKGMLDGTIDVGEEIISNYSLNPALAIGIAAKYGIIFTRNGVINLYNELDEPEDKRKKYMQFLTDLLSPSFLAGGDGGLIGEYFELDRQSLLDSDRTPAQIAANLVGINIQPVNITTDLLKANDRVLFRLSKLERDFYKKGIEIETDIRYSEEEKLKLNDENKNKYERRIEEIIDEETGGIINKEASKQYNSNKLTDILNVINNNLNSLKEYLK